jgi:hypothetical protein
VEGFELGVLQGADALLSAEQQPIVQVKLNDERLARYGVHRRDIVDYLVQRKYDVFEMEPGGAITRGDGSRWVELFCVGRGVYADRFRSVFLGA